MITMREYLKTAREKLGNFASIYRERAISFVGIVAVGVLGFEFGAIEGQSRISSPPVIRVSEVSALAVRPDASVVPATNAAPSMRETPPDTGACVFVGSKNSDKYHLPACSFAKRIKPENRVCFASEEDAKAKGYQPGCLR
jgi:hypothetical protein